MLRAARQKAYHARDRLTVAGPRVKASLPILMYHRVAATGSRALDRWRITPDQLDEQLGYLRAESYRFVSLQRWHAAVAHRQTLAPRSVCITFDDAYVDFAENAWPLLRRHGFRAHLFVVTGEAGGWNRWDGEYGERVPLLGWDELATLRDDGVLLGAHTATHPKLTTLPEAEARRELELSRAELHDRLGVEAHAAAYPYGDVHRGIERLAAEAGFRQAVTCASGRARLGNRLLALPRIEVSSHTGVEELATRLG